MKLLPDNPLETPDPPAFKPPWHLLVRGESVATGDLTEQRFLGKIDRLLRRGEIVELSPTFYGD